MERNKHACICLFIWISFPLAHARRNNVFFAAFDPVELAVSFVKIWTFSRDAGYAVGFSFLGYCRLRVGPHRVYWFRTAPKRLAAGARKASD